MISASLCTSYKRELFTGIHTGTDTYKIALYRASASLDSETKQFTTNGEITGSGYSTGGKVLTGFRVGAKDCCAWLDFDDAYWGEATLTARGALIYNSSKANRAVAVLDFGKDMTTTSRDFKIVFPDPMTSAALISLN